MSEINRGYYAIIPAGIRYNNEIPPAAKLLYSEITALCNAEGYCCIGNEYFTELYGVSKRTVQRWINILANKSYLAIEFQYKEGSKEVLKRYIKLFDSSVSCSEKTVECLYNKKDENSCLGGDKNVTTWRQNCHGGGDNRVLGGDKIVTTSKDDEINENIKYGDEGTPIGDDKNVTTLKADKINEKFNMSEIKGGDIGVQDDYIYNNKYNNIYINNNNIRHSGLEAEKKQQNKKNIYETVMDLYIKTCTKLSKPIKLTDKRKTSIKKLLNMYTLEQVEAAFKIINNSYFCTGDNDRGWRADFDFCININKVTNALEGKYPPQVQQSKPKPANMFHNFAGKIENYSESELEKLAQKKKEKLFNNIAGDLKE